MSRYPFTAHLVDIRDELEEPLKNNVVVDPDGEGTVSIPVALYFHLLGFITWLSLDGDNADDDNPS